MAVSPTAPAGATATTAQTQKSASTPVISSDFETFLKMLTVQMENQDPLNPIESSDYAVQLATFSGVEQQVQTNDLIKALSAQMGQNQLADLSGWIGREVPAPVAAAFNGSPLTLSYTPHPAALENELIVSDSNGQVVERRPLPKQAGPIEWNGTDGLGSPYPHGAYSFSMRSSDGTGVIAETAIPIYVRITEVQSTAKGVDLILSGGGKLKASEVSAIRAAR